MGEHSGDVVRRRAAQGKVFRDVRFEKPAMAAGLQTGRGRAAFQRANEEQAGHGIGRGWMALAGAIPNGGQLHRPDAVAGLLEHLAHHRFGGGLIDLGPAAREGPTVVIDGFANHEDAAFRVEHCASDADFRGGVAGFGGQKPLQPPQVGAGMFGENSGTEALKRLIALDVVRVLGEGEAGLGDRQKLPRPDQPVRFGRGKGGQEAGSVTIAGRATGPAVPETSASVRVRQTPATRTSDGRKRAL